MKRLILVEGLPGTGKTTISKWLSNTLIDRGESVILMNEGDERIPCDFYRTAGIPKNEFESLCIQHHFQRDILFKTALLTKNYVFLRIDKCPAHVSQKIECWDMGEESNPNILVADYIACMLERLEYWVGSLINSSETVIIDSGYLQNPINELLFRNATNDEVRAFINAITELLIPLNPICIYLRRDNAEEAISFAKMAKGKGWADGVDELLKQNGCENFFQRRFELELELLQNIENINCHITGNNWDDVKNLILRYLSQEINEVSDRE